ncbi:YtxH domain-containing protein [Metabacillus sp. JX24]|uniref:YtxH domain-containing protein n=1 Tax=Metabacillus sp. JX24 TaxID=3240759 RepID=UPI00350F1715
MSESNSLFLKGVFAGAAIGGAITLLHKPTRDQFVRQGITLKDKTAVYIENPSLLTEEIKEQIDKARAVVQEAKDDIDFINEKINELKETTPQVLQMIEETKERFLTDK